MQVAEHTNAIRDAKGRCDEFTRGDVGRLQRMSLVSHSVLPSLCITGLSPFYLSLSLSVDLGEIRSNKDEWRKEVNVMVVVADK